MSAPHQLAPAIEKIGGILHQFAPALEHLAARCEAGARRAGLRAIKRPFRAHVTLAYLRGAEPASVGRWIASHNLFAGAPFSVESFGLYSSHQTAAGSYYRLERGYPLRSALQRR